MKRKLFALALAASLMLGVAVSAPASEVKSEPSLTPTTLQKAPERASQPVVSVHEVKVPGIDYGAVKAKLDAGDAFGALLALLLGSGGVGLAMATLAANKPRAFEIGERNEYPVIASDIIYEGGAVGIVDATGHARPLVNPDRFGGFAEAKADNSAGAAAAINVRVVESGKIELAVTGAVITDVGQPVYATDDDTYVFNPAGGVFVGFVHRFVSSGKVIVAFDALNYRDPWAHYTVRETLSGIKTFDAEDSGKLFCVDSDADGDALTLPAIATGLDGIAILAVSAFGTTLVKIDPAAADMILGPDITGADNKDLLLTKATQRRGDFVVLGGNDADGYSVQQMRGIWAREA